MTPRALLAARGLHPKKRFGQNFLVDAGTARKIAALCVEAPGEPIVEVGAGTGALTRELLALGADVTAIEIDEDLVAVLRERDDLPGLRLVAGDALAVDYGALAAARPWSACGNLPYNVATPLILGWIGLVHPPDRIVAMVQRDVADRFVAAAGSAAYGSLSLYVQYAMEVRRAFVLGPSAFYPRPKVDSAVVVMRRRAQPPVAVRDPAFLLQVVRAGFAYRRKTLANSLSLALGIDRARTTSALATLLIDSEIRAEQIDLGGFAALADALGP